VRVGQSYTRSLAAIELESLCHLKRVCTSMLRATPPVCMALIFVFVALQHSTIHHYCFCHRHSHAHRAQHTTAY